VKLNIRSGCYCNQGSCDVRNDLSDEEVEKAVHEKTSCGHEADIVDGKATGSIRISLGAYSTFEDIYKLISFLKDTYIDYTKTHEPKCHFVRLQHSVD